MNEVSLMFSRDNNDGNACIDFAWIASGKRSHLVLRQGEHYKIHKDTFKDDEQTIVNVFALTDKKLGLDKPWQSLKSKSGIILAVFQVTGNNVNRAIYYADGSQQTSSTPMTQQPLRCPG